MADDDGRDRRRTRLLWATLAPGLLVLLIGVVDRPGILDGENDCADGAFVTRRAPLGTRAVVDGSSGERLAVSAPD